MVDSSIRFRLQLFCLPFTIRVCYLAAELKFKGKHGKISVIHVDATIGLIVVCKF